MAANLNLIDRFLTRLDNLGPPLLRFGRRLDDTCLALKKNMELMRSSALAMTDSMSILSKAFGPAMKHSGALQQIGGLGVSDNGLDELNEKSKAFSAEYGLNATRFVESAYTLKSAIRDLTDSQLSTFTEASALLAKATKSDAATIDQYVGTMHGIFDDQAQAMGKAQWVQKLAGTTSLAVKLFGTTGEQMKAAFSGVAKSAALAGVDMAEQMAVLGTLQQTLSGAAAGSSYKAFLGGVISAQKKLGMSFTDSQGQLLPMLEILDKLKAKFGDTLDLAETGELKAAFGSAEASELLKLLINDSSGLADSIQQLGQVNGLEQTRRQALANVTPMERLSETINVLSMTLGEQLLPVLNPLIDNLSQGAAALSAWVKENPRLSKTLALVALVMGAVGVAVATLTFLFGALQLTMLALGGKWKLLNLTALKGAAIFLIKAAKIALLIAALLSLGVIIAAVKGAMLLWQGVIWLVNAALTANPVGVIIMAIAALIGLVVAAVYFWDEWTSALMQSEAFEWISAKLEALNNLFGSAGGWAGVLKAAWDGIASVFKSGVQSLIDLLNRVPGVNIATGFDSLPELPDATSMSGPVDLEVDTRVRQSISAPSLFAKTPSAVPPGGLLSSIQNNSHQGKSTHIEKIEIRTDKPMTQHHFNAFMERMG